MSTVSICENCHFTLLRPHPEDKFRDEGYLKCPLCGFSKQIKKEILELHRIINGTPGKKDSNSGTS